MRIDYTLTSFSPIARDNLKSLGYGLCHDVFKGIIHVIDDAREADIFLGLGLDYMAMVTTCLI
jgi:hypothetical protein